MTVNNEFIAAIVSAAFEWSAARTVCLAHSTVTIEQYNRLAAAEAALQAAIKAHPSEP